MEIRSRSDGDLEIIALSGRITLLDGVEPLRRRFREAVSEGRRHFLFDLRELLFMDSSSIGELVACLKRASEVSGTVELLVRPRGTIDSVIQLSGMNRVFRVYYDEAELERFGPRREADPGDGA
jgi:anti-sigma B factor antagonist